MSDNGQQSSNDTPQEILRVDLIGTKVQPQINSQHLPMLTFALELLRIEVDKMIIDSQIREKQKNNPIIQKPHNIIDWMRRR